MQVTYCLDEATAATLARLGRTEDIQFSPDNTRLAVAVAGDDCVLVVDVALPAGDDAGEVRLSRGLVLTSDLFRFPHGLCWLDDETLLVANRLGEVPMVRVPRVAGRLHARPVAMIHGDHIDGLSTPGSVASRRLSGHLHEVLVCNNYSHNVSRHLLQDGAEVAVFNSHVLLGEGLNIPDGVAYSPCGGWIGVSNHHAHCIHLHADTAALTRHALPEGRLTGVDYPHGLRFAAGGRAILVADAGAPLVHLYVQPQGDWRGEHAPVHSLRVVDDATFEAGRANKEEGGPKGIDLCRAGRTLVVSCEHQPLAFFRVDHLLAEKAGAPPVPASARAEAAGAVLLRHARALRAHQDACGRAALATRAELEAMLQTHHALHVSHQALLGAHHEAYYRPFRHSILPRMKAALAGLLRR